jgi:hypothetical protein
MTQLLPALVECCQCGTRSEQVLVYSMETSGAPDMDTRPAEPARATLPYWVQRCPACKYCAKDISLEYPQAERVMRTQEYQKLLRRHLPEKAREFLAWALIEEANDEPGAAGWSALHAAWTCDDAARPPAAAECRRLALARFSRQRARQGHVTGFDIPGVTELVLADLCRRTGQFTAAEGWCGEGLSIAAEAGIRRALEKEISLIWAEDLGGHNLEEV